MENHAITVITLYDNNVPKISGVLNAELTDYVCQRVGIDAEKFNDYIQQMQEQGLVELSQATLH